MYIKIIALVKTTANVVAILCLSSLTNLSKLSLVVASQVLCYIFLTPYKFKRIQDQATD